MESQSPLRPDEWPHLIDRIRNSSDEDVKALLMQREQRFQNYLGGFYYQDWDPIWRDSGGAQPATFAVRSGWIMRRGLIVEYSFLISTGDSMAGTTGQMYVEIPTDLPADVDATYGWPVGSAQVQQSFPGAVQPGLNLVLTAGRIQFSPSTTTVVNFTGGITWRALGFYKTTLAATL